jgi:hypothetical protein
MLMDKLKTLTAYILGGFVFLTIFGITVVIGLIISPARSFEGGSGFWIFGAATSLSMASSMMIIPKAGMQIFARVAALPIGVTTIVFSIPGLSEEGASLFSLNPFWGSVSGMTIGVSLIILIRFMRSSTKS